MTNKEYDIIKQFIQVVVDTAYTRCTVKMGASYGFITRDDIDKLLQRIRILVEDEVSD